MSAKILGDFDLLDGLAAIQEARLTDFMRYAGRIGRERPDLREMEFKYAFNILIGGYMEMALTPMPADEDEDEL